MLFIFEEVRNSDNKNSDFWGSCLVFFWLFCSYHAINMKLFRFPHRSFIQFFSICNHHNGKFLILPLISTTGGGAGDSPECPDTTANVETDGHDDIMEPFLAYKHLSWSKLFARVGKVR